MMLAGVSLSASALASLTPQSTATTDAEGGAPLNVLLNNVFSRQYIQVNTLQIEDTLGEQVTCSFVIVNPAATPVVGDVVEVRYFSQVLFAGTIDRIRRSTNNTLTARLFECTATDWSQILVRNKIQRNFVNIPIVNLVDSLLDNELADEELTMGRTDRATEIPLVDSRGGSAFDMLRDAAGVTGQTFYVDFDKSIQFRVTSNDVAPIEFDTSTIETATLTIDRETYRNVQTVVVTGTPASESSTDANVSVQVRQNDDQIAARAAIEGGTGRYEHVEEVTHPTSNDTGELALLGIGFANLRLATSGTPRQVLQCRVRNYGFRAGQFATVDLSSLGASGTWLIQRVSVRDEDGRKLVHELELVQSSLQQRAYESWLNIVSGGKITVQMPSSLTTNSTTFTTPGTDTWTVPAGVTTITVTCRGAGGGVGGGNWAYTSSYVRVIGAGGGNGGNGGRAISIISVTEGQEFDLTIGAAGVGGDNGYSNGTLAWYVAPTDGATGGTSTVALGAIVHCQGNGGEGGTAAPLAAPYWGSNGSDGSGAGDARSIGGGSPGGTFLYAYGSYPGTEPSGTDGYVTIEW